MARLHRLAGKCYNADDHVCLLPRSGSESLSLMAQPCSIGRYRVPYQWVKNPIFDILKCALM
jgi:hypothetical protein